MAYLRCTGTLGGSLKLRTAQGEIASFETTLPEPYQSVLANVEATGGNGTPDNPNPIVGYSSANITVDSKNLLNIADFSADTYRGVTFSCSNGVINANGTADRDLIYVLKPSSEYVTVDNIFDVKPDVQYTLNGCSGGSYNYTYWLQLLISGSGAEPYSGNGDSSPFSFTAAQIASQQRQIAIRIKSGTVMNNVKFYPMIRPYAITDSTFEQYNGQTYAIAFGQTVYVGVLDVTRGKLSVTWGGKDMGDLTWVRNTQYNNPIFLANIPEAKNATASGEIANSKCAILTPTTAQNCNNVSYDNCYSIMLYFNSNYNINVIAKAYNDVPSFVSAVTGKILIYELDTPFDIDLTPEVISAIVGTNNVFTDCGETEVKYLYNARNNES